MKQQKYVTTLSNQQFIKRAFFATLLVISCFFSTEVLAGNFWSKLFGSTSHDGVVGRGAVDRGAVDRNIKSILAKTPTMNSSVLKLGLEAYYKARKAGLDSQQLLTIVDYSKPSSEPRLWVLNIRDNTVLFHEYVAHGKNSGDNIPYSFSDKPNSLKSSLGVFLTESSYYGHHGYSLKVEGLEKGFNDNASSRAIVFHGARYVSAQFARLHGRLGHSWGCFAVNPTVAKTLINTIKGGTIVFAYYPDQRWLSSSHFLS